MNITNKKSCFRKAMTMLELVLALTMITIVFAVLVPQFVLLRNSWDVKQATAESLQNGRVLVDHISRNLSKAVKISAVSAYTSTNGYIQFVANDSNTYRYDISARNYVEFGRVGSLSDLAGPVSSLKFTCYDACDLDSPLPSGMDENDIRVVKVDATVSNSGSLGHDKTFIAWAYLRTNANNSGLVGCWKLDETSGLTAADNSGCGNNGTLTNMAGNEWTSGIINGALNFNGTNNYVDCGNNLSLRITSNITVAAWVKTKDCGDNQHNPYVAKGDRAYSLQQGWNNYLEFFIYDTTWYGATYLVDSSFNDVWHHLAGTYDGSQVKLYVDGILRNTVNHSGSIATNAYNVNLGRNAENTTQFYNGALDDVRIYNRALSASEIADLANPVRYRDFREYKAGYYLSNAPIATPTANAGDLLIAAVATYGDTSASLSPPAGQGWTLIDRGTTSGLVTLGVWWKTAGASEPSTHNFTWSGSCQAYGWMMRFTGQNPTNPINASSAGGETSSAPTSPAVTTTLNSCLILRLGAFNGDDIVVDSPGLSGHTAITMDESGSTSGVVTYGGFTEAKVSADGTSITIAKPTGTNSGDLLLAAVAADGVASTIGWASASGWSGILPGVPQAPALGIWYKTAGASEPADYTFSWTASEQAYGWIMRFTGNSPTLVGFSPSWGTSSTPSCSSVTGSGGMMNFLILRLGAFDDDAITIDNPGLPSDHNAITMDRSNTGAGSCSGGAGYQNKINGGSSTNFTLTSSKAYATASIPLWPNGCWSNTVSGGAGYVRQSIKGSSGTSTFSLGSSSEARMLTIAIAPANYCADCSQDQLRP